MTPIYKKWLHERIIHGVSIFIVFLLWYIYSRASRYNYDRSLPLSSTCFSDNIRALEKLIERFLFQRDLFSSFLSWKNRHSHPRLARRITVSKINAPFLFPPSRRYFWRIVTSFVQQSFRWQCVLSACSKL